MVPLVDGGNDLGAAERVKPRSVPQAGRDFVLHSMFGCQCNIEKVKI